MNDGVPGERIEGNFPGSHEILKALVHSHRHVVKCDVVLHRVVLAKIDALRGVALCREPGLNRHKTLIAGAPAMHEKNRISLTIGHGSSKKWEIESQRTARRVARL